jgi:hypothetical protein
MVIPRKTSRESRRFFSTVSLVVIAVILCCTFYEA